MADAADTRALLLTIQANTELLRSNLTAAERSLNEFAGVAEKKLSVVDAAFEKVGHVSKEVGAALGITASLFAVDSLVEGAIHALEYAANLGIVAKQVGVTAEQLQILHYAAGQVGVSTEEADRGIQKFVKSLGQARTGSEATAKILRALSFSDSEIKHLDVYAALLKTAEGLSQVTDRATRGAAEVKLFGRAGQQLDPLLSQGSKGIEEFAKQAEHLGLIMSDALVERAHEAEVRVKALKSQLEVSIARVVSENAGAITGLANSLSELVANALHATRAYAGLVNIIKTEGVGAAVRVIFKGDGSDQFAAGDPKSYARAKINANNVARANLIAGRGQSPENDRRLRGIYDEAHRVAVVALGNARNQQAEEDAAAKLAKEEAKTSQGGLGDSSGSGGGGRSRGGVKAGKSADELAREAKAQQQRDLANDSAFQSELRGAQQSLARAKVELADTAEAQLAVDLEILRDEKITRDQQVDNQVAEGKISAARGDQLKALNAETEKDEEILAKRKAQARTISESYQRSQLELQGQIDLLSLDDRLATTRKERLKIELQILALQERAAIAEQQAIIDKETSTKEERLIAQGRIDQIKAQSGRNQETVRRQNADPLQQYSDQLKASVGDVNDALKGVEVDGLKGLEDGLTGIITGTESVGDAFKKMADLIIADLIRIGVEKLILSVIGGGDSGSGGGGGFLSIFGNLFGHKDGFTPGFATGNVPGFAAGLISGPGTGTSDSILALMEGRGLIRVSNGESIMTDQATQRYGAILKAMNDNTLPGFATGFIPEASIAYPRLPQASEMSQGGGPVQIMLHVTKGEAFDAHVIAVSGPHTAKLIQQATPTIQDGATLQTLDTMNRSHGRLGR